MRILVASYNRAGTATTMDKIPSAEIVVPESQADEYRKHYGERVVSIPDHKDGNVAKKRNAILELVDEGELFWMLDDDLLKVIRIKQGEELDPEQVLESHYHSMESYDFDFGGFSIYNDPVKYAEYQPFSLTKPSFQAVCIRRLDGLRYDEDLGRHEDTDYFLRVLHRGSRVLRDNRIFFEFECNKDKATSNQKGGIIGGDAAFQSAAEKLIARWGSAVKVDGHRVKGPASVRTGV